MKKDPNEFIFVKKKLNPKSSAHVLPPPTNNGSPLRYAIS